MLTGQMDKIHVAMYGNCFGEAYTLHSQLILQDMKMSFCMHCMGQSGMWLISITGPWYCSNKCFNILCYIYVRVHNHSTGIEYMHIYVP